MYIHWTYMKSGFYNGRNITSFKGEVSIIIIHVQSFDFVVRQAGKPMHAPHSLETWNALLALAS